MTDVLLVCTKSGAFFSLKAEGHSGFASSGYDIVCSAITFLLRTTMQVLDETEGIRFYADTSLRGNLAFRVEVQGDISEKLESRLECIADILRKGLTSLSKEYPKYIKLRETQF
ncbi:MAG: ribosomal-processing cysteine protease Prp [Treponema sp.]|nr:ribosomal-processing cysteine protease Prp [Treponema sp.]